MNRKLPAVIIAKKMADGGIQEDSEDEHYKSAVMDLMKALRMDDHAKACEAFRVACQLVDEEPQQKGMQVSEQEEY